ncbi:hypothetical protein FOC4_g10014675 [Fusarium odoratissimum]|uniref:Uncharacterized protein n=2 Tax=Fusarium oxysporum species complex TaxID=171631 RepID=N1R933_FUSC4|nr:hypothetical protein FOC4_g10014675 [Fusarium odoratissimum]ENH61289.1 hypothetical protein FOC1_g10016103 [Fusarium oxysporum f. sp. cubense race 1]
MCNSAAQGGFRTDQAEGLCDPHGLSVFICIPWSATAISVSLASY